MSATIPTSQRHDPAVAPARRRDDHGRLRDTWPLAWRDLGLLVVACAVVIGVFTGLGLLITGPLDGSALVRGDEDVARWMEERRTPGWNDAAVIGSGLSDTLVKVVFTAIVVVALLAVLKRWYESLVVAVSLVFEATAFITITTLVGRSRPAVERLQESPVNSSFPSGHTAAAVAYGAMALVVIWHTRRTWLRVLVVAATAAVALAVSVSRVYQGMHFVSDVVAGALLGLVSVAITAVVLRRAAERSGVEAPGGGNSAPWRSSATTSHTNR